MDTFKDRQAANQSVVSWLFKLGCVIAVAALFMTSCVQTSENTGLTTVPSTLSEASWPAPVLGVAVDGTMTILDIDPLSAAQTAGLQKGDVLVAIEGVSFADTREKAREIVGESPGEQAYLDFAEGKEWKGITKRLQIKRGEELIELEIVPIPPQWDPKEPPTAMPTDQGLYYL